MDNSSLVFSMFVPKWVRVRILSRRALSSVASLLSDADNFSEECFRQQPEAYTAFARNRLGNYGREIAKRSAGVCEACSRRWIRTRGVKDVEDRVKKLLGLLDTARELLKLDADVRSRAPEVRRKYIETRTQAANLLSGEAEQLFRVGVLRFQHSYDRLPKACDIAEVRSCLAELENMVNNLRSILDRRRRLEADLEIVRAAMEPLDRKMIVRDPDASDQWNKLQLNWSAAREALASGALGRGEVLLRDARKYLSRTAEYLQKVIRNAEVEVRLWRDVLPFADGLSDDLRSRLLAIPQVPSGDDLQEWDIIKEELERETTIAAARTRAGYATVLQTKSCQLRWGDSDLAKYKSYVRQTRRTVVHRANTLPTPEGGSSIPGTTT
jgi:hypothetical protein